MKVTYFLEVLSSWCWWAEPAWEELKRRYSGQVTFDWKIALMNPADFPATAEQCEWFYRRSGTVMRSPIMLNTGWCEGRDADYSVPNLVAEAARELGVKDDRVRSALSFAALVEGRRIAHWDVALSVAASAGKLDAAVLGAKARSGETRRKVEASTADFHALQVTQRPAFLLENNIGDRAVLSGIVMAAPLAATIDAMLADALAYQSYAAHHGRPPQG